ncbi:Bifunctional hemolysin/adenylate cyclase [Bienertia sinuspersici]
MRELAMTHRAIDLYMLHEAIDPSLSPEPLPKTLTHFQPINKKPTSSKPHKLTPRRGPPHPSKKQTRLPIVICFGIFNPKLETFPHSSLSPFKKGSSIELLVKNTSGFSTEPLFTENTNPKSPLKASQISNINKPPTNDQLEIPTFNNELLQYDFYDPRPESPLKYNELFSESSEDSDNPLYNPVDGDVSGEESYSLIHDGGEESDSLTHEDDIEVELGDDEALVNDEFGAGELDNSDEEFQLAIQRLRSCTSRSVQIAQQLQEQVAEETSDKGYVSDYYDSDDDMDTPPNSDDENGGVRRFTDRENFKDVVGKYAIMQGRNVHVVITNKIRRQELGVRCVQGCPFYLYSSRHSYQASYTVKVVNNEHKCHRNMKKNKKFKSTWVAKEMLEVFKARPY